MTTVVISNLISGIVKEANTQQVKATSLQPGQVFYGKITKLFPNGIAALQVGSQKIVAQLEAALEANEPYWFQVMPGEGKTRLKVLGNAADNGRNETTSLVGLLKDLSIPVTKGNQSLLRFFLKEQLPVNKEMFQLASQLLTDSGFNQAGMEAVKQLINKQLPLTIESFQSILSAIVNESFSDLLETLKKFSPQHPSTVAGKELVNFIDSMKASQINMTNIGQDFLVNTAQSTGDSVDFAQYFKGLMNQMGFSYEHDVAQFLKHPGWENEPYRDALKPLIIDFLHENPPDTLREIAEKILHKITGIQLLAQESGPFQQFAVQIPIMLWQKPVDLTMQWSGKRQDNGQIDPAFCRVLFYLDLQYLRDTIVDMQVQNRIVKITVMNENEHLKQISAPFIPQLKEHLQSMGYTLSAVGFNMLSDELEKKSTQSVTSLYGANHYSGVDIRI